MRVVVIGGTGHVGTYLVPRLVRMGHEVVNLSRNRGKPYRADPAWGEVEQIVVDRDTKEADGEFGNMVRNLRPDIVIDMICFTPESARMIVEALRERIQHYLCCGTIWVHGPSVEIPTLEHQARNPFGDYGVNKAAIEDYLLEQARRSRFPATIIHPGHIVGPGWMPLNPQGNFNPEVFSALARGDRLRLPNMGMETVHHVHAGDVAQSFIQAMVRYGQAVGESFHAVSRAALTLRGFAESAASWFGKSANLEFVPWDQWRETVSAEDAAATWDHIAHSPNCSIEKAASMLNYNPRYSSLEAVRESVEWLVEQGIVKIG